MQSFDRCDLVVNLGRHSDIALEFADACKSSSEAPPIEGYLSRCAEDAFAQLELVLIDHQNRWQSRLQLPIGAYFEKASALSTDPDCRIQLLEAELIELRKVDDAGAVAELFEKYPELYATVIKSVRLDSDPASASGDPFKTIPDQAASDHANSDSPSGFASPGASETERYKIVRELGRGGFATVFLALDKHLDREVAIKVLHADRFAKGEQSVEFVREAKLTAKLNHPSIVTLYDVDRTEDGIVYIVMEHVDGESLATRLKGGSISDYDAIEAITQAAHALEYAHRHGFVHRDLKPANILIDSEGRCRVADFGLAINEDLHLARKGELAGTPAYMSPEQTRGLSHQLDGRSDLWSLGVILYQVLTGRMPFRGDDLDGLFDEIRNRRPRPPTQWNRNVQPALQKICLKCLTVEIQYRYASAREVITDLEASLPFVEMEQHPDIGNRWAMIAAGLVSIFGGGMMAIVGGFFLSIAWISLHGPFGIACTSASTFFIGLATFAGLSSPLFVGLPLIILGIWLILVRGGKNQHLRRTSGKAIASLAFASMTPLFNLFAAIPAILLARQSFREINRRYPRLHGKTYGVLGIGGAILGVLMSGAITLRAWHLVSAFQAADRAEAALQRGEFEEAVFEATLATKGFPEMAVGWELRGIAEVNRQQPDRAINHLTKAIGLFDVVTKNAAQTPPDTQPPFHLARSYAFRAKAYDQLNQPAAATRDRQQSEKYLANVTGLPADFQFE